MNVRGVPPSPVLDLARKRGLDASIVARLAAGNAAARYRDVPAPLFDHADQLVLRWNGSDGLRVDAGHAAHELFARVARVVPAARQTHNEWLAFREVPIIETEVFVLATVARARLLACWRYHHPWGHHPPGYVQHARFRRSSAQGVLDDVRALLAAIRYRLADACHADVTLAELLTSADKAAADLQGEIIRRTSNLDRVYLGDLRTALVSLLYADLKLATAAARHALHFQPALMREYRPNPPRSRKRSRPVDDAGA